MAAVTLTPTGIRTDLVTRLTGKTAAGARVFDSRQIDLDEVEELPAVCVYSVGGREEKKARSAPLHRRTEQLGISAVVKGSDDAALAAAVDTMEQALLAALNEDAEWLRAFELVGPFDSQKHLDIDSDQRLGGVTLRLDVTYHVQYGVSGGNAAPFTKAAVTTDSSEPAGADVSQRVIALAGAEP